MLLFTAYEQLIGSHHGFCPDNYISFAMSGSWEIMLYLFTIGNWLEAFVIQ